MNFDKVKCSSSQHLMCTLNFYLTFFSFFFLLWIPSLDSHLRSVRLTTNLQIWMILCSFYVKKILEICCQLHSSIERGSLKLHWGSLKSVSNDIRAYKTICVDAQYIYLFIFQVGIKCKRISLLFYESFFQICCWLHTWFVQDFFVILSLPHSSIASIYTNCN